MTYDKRRFHIAWDPPQMPLLDRTWAVQPQPAPDGLFRATYREECGCLAMSHESDCPFAKPEEKKRGES